MVTGPIESPVDAIPQATPSPSVSSSARAHSSSATATTWSADWPSASRQNSSPPSRAARLPGSFAADSDSWCANRSSIRSPISWPCWSLTRFSPFMSHITSDTTVPPRLCAFSASSSRASTARRFARPVSASVNASRRRSATRSVWARPAEICAASSVAYSASASVNTGIPVPRARYSSPQAWPCSTIGATRQQPRPRRRRPAARERQNAPEAGIGCPVCGPMSSAVCTQARGRRPVVQCSSRYVTISGKSATG